MHVSTSDLDMFQQQIETICVTIVVRECSKYGMDELNISVFNMELAIFLANILVIGISVILHIGAPLILTIYEHLLVPGFSCQCFVLFLLQH